MTDKHEYGPWTIWNGGECPVPEGTLVQVQLGKEPRTVAERNGPYGPSYRRWLHCVRDTDIIAYRVLKQPVLNTVSVRTYIAGYPCTITYETIDGKPSGKGEIEFHD